MPKFTQADVAAIIKEEGIESLTAKTVRVKLEAKLGLEPGALKAQKDEISATIDAVLSEDNGDGDDAEEEEEEEEEAPAPKAKKAKTGKDDDAPEVNPNKGKMSCTTRSGEEAPKNIKKIQVRAFAPAAARSASLAHAIKCVVRASGLRRRA